MAARIRPRKLSSFRLIFRHLNLENLLFTGLGLYGLTKSCLLLHANFHHSSEFGRALRYVAEVGRPVLEEAHPLEKEAVALASYCNEFFIALLHTTLSFKSLASGHEKALCIVAGWTGSILAVFLTYFLFANILNRVIYALLRR